MLDSSRRTVILLAVFLVLVFSSALFTIRGTFVIERQEPGLYRFVTANNKKKGKLEDTNRKEENQQQDRKLQHKKLDKRKRISFSSFSASASFASNSCDLLTDTSCQKRVLSSPHFSDFPEYSFNSNVSSLLAESAPLQRHLFHFSEEEQGEDENEGDKEEEEEEEQKLRALVRDHKCPQQKPLRHLPEEKEKVVRLYVPTPFPHTSCGVPCKLTNNKDEIPHVHGFVVDTNGAEVNDFKIYNWRQNPLNKILIAYNTENIEGRRASLKKAYGLRYLAKPWNRTTFWRNFDIVISFQTGSHIWTSWLFWAACRDDSFLAGFRYWKQEAAQKLKNIAKWRKEEEAANNNNNNNLEKKNPRGKLVAKRTGGNALVVFFVRNCNYASHRRAGFMRRLSKHVLIDSVGRCEQTKEQNAVRICTGFPNRNKRGCILSDYPFYLAIENSISLDYVTEKLFEALLVGTIPVVLSAPNVEDFLPARHSAILVRDFPSLSALARYLKCIAANSTLYEYYTSWHERPLLPRFKELHRNRPASVFCEACTMIARAKFDRKVFQSEHWKSRRDPGASARMTFQSGDQAPLPQCL